MPGFPPDPNRRLRVFLCHSSGDKPAVRRMYSWLKEDGYLPWLDEESLGPGEDWQLAIQAAIKDADVVLVCLSPGSISKTGYVQKEIAYLLDYAEYQPEGSTYVIPVRLEGCAIPKRLERWHAVDLYYEMGWSRLLGALDSKALSVGGLTVPHQLRDWGLAHPTDGMYPLPQPNLTGRYGTDEDDDEIVLNPIFDDRYYFSRRGIIGVGIFQFTTFLGAFRNTASGRWGTVQGTLFAKDRLVMHSSVSVGRGGAFDETWIRRPAANTNPSVAEAEAVRSLPSPDAVGLGFLHLTPIQRQYLICGVERNPVCLALLGPEVLSVQTAYWHGIGLFDGRHYLGVYRYNTGVQGINFDDTPSARFIGVWGVHEGDVLPGGSLAIHGRNVLGIPGEFDITWDPVADPIAAELGAAPDPART